MNRIAAQLKISFPLVALFFLPAIARAQGSTWIVDVGGGPGSHFAQIQPAIDAAQSGDTILVKDGIYSGDGNKNLNFGGKILVVRSENGPQNCIIDPDWDGRGFVFNSGETADARVEGFTIRDAGVAPIYWTDGWIWFYITDGAGGGIVCYDSSPTFENCIVRDCHAVGYEEDPGQGGGVLLSSSDSIFRNCAIVGNETSSGGGFAQGGGIHSEGGNPQILNCLIADNHAQNIGGGLSLVFSNPVLRNCTVVNNTASITANGGGGFHGTFATVTLRNSIVRDNKTYGLGGPFTNQVDIYYGSLNIGYSVLQGGQAGVTGQSVGIVWGDGNFDLDPLFAEPSSGDYSILAGSPCIDAGSNGEAPLGDPIDLAGNPRFVDDPSICDSGEGETPVVDMGAYEFQPSPGAWVNLGAALAGANGKPCLVGSGDLSAGSAFSLQLSSAASNAASFLVVGGSALNLPFKGGVLVPSPDRILGAFLTDPSGSISFAGSVPVNLPSGLTLYFQFWVVDPAGPFGFSASNAVSGTTP